MQKSRKIIAVLPAYNAAKTLAAFVRAFSKGVFDEIILVDDCSLDDTFGIAKRIRSMTSYRNVRNLGYGGNLKMCLGTALDHGADIIVELHPDGEYGTDAIAPALEKVASGARLVLGNRFAGKLRGMSIFKRWGTRTLSIIDSWLFAQPMPDAHQGFRVYTRALLERIPYRRFADDYLFSYQMIAAAVAHALPISFVPVSAHYRGKKRGARWGASFRYALATFAVRIGYLRGAYRSGTKEEHLSCPFCGQWYLTARKLHIGPCSLWYCSYCHIGFTHPVPTSLASYYPAEYYHTPGLLGKLKTVVFTLAQRRRVTWIRECLKEGRVLDVGAGTGTFGRSLSWHGFHVTSVDAPFTTPEDPAILAVDFLKWKTGKRFDAVVFWESLEHVPDALAYLQKVKKFLKPHGWLFIEYPRYGCLESRLFGRYWFHLDMPRHLTHFTDSGMNQLLARAGFTLIRQRGIWALDYAPWGLVRSVALFPLGVVVAWVLHLAGQSPIGLVVAKRDLPYYRGRGKVVNVRLL